MGHRIPVLFLLTLMASAATAQLPHQTLVDLSPSDDAHTYNLSPATSYGSDPTLNIGKVSNSPLEVYRGHFRFDLSPLGPSPAIVRAELRWYQTSSSAGGLEVDLHALTTPWSESTISWSNQPAPGAELLNQDVGGAAGWYVWDLSCLARDWASGTTPNHGVVIKDPESTAGATRPGYGVSKEGAAAQRPVLRVLANTAYGAEIGAPRGSVESGDVPFTFRLVDLTPGSSTATCSYSTDGGATWLPAGGGMFTGSPLGALCRHTWDSAAAGVGLTASTPIRFRIDLAGAGMATLDYDLEVDNRVPTAGLLFLPPAADVSMTNRNQCEPPGQSPLMTLGKEHNSPPQWNRGLFRFDTSRIPPGTIVASAHLGYYQYAGGGAGGQTVTVYRVTQSWAEETVTWATTPTWDPAVVTTLSVGDVFANGYQRFDITALAQQWIDGVVPNLGVIIKDGETTAGAWRESRGYSREHGNPMEQPYLELDLGAPPASCQVLSPSATVESATVLVDYLAASPTSALASITPSFSTDGGLSWAAATQGVGGDGLAGLTTSPVGTAHVLAWDTAVDVPGSLGATPVVLELQIDDGSSTSVCDTAFTVDNSPTCTVPLCGDCNGDLTITILDALVAAQHAAALITLTGSAFSSCNVQGAIEPDPLAAVSILDALALAQAAAGLPVALVCC